LYLSLTETHCSRYHPPKKGKAGCFAVADFWKEIGSMSKTDALVQLEKFFYQGLEHKGVQLPAVINFTHYTHGTGQVRSIIFMINHSVLTTMLSIAGTEVKTVKYCAW
jgi:hypothetical protein